MLDWTNSNQRESVLAGRETELKKATKNGSSGWKI